ncbi:hypothetical protein [Actinoplanes sp. NPDC049316]|uniref:hypothetical protein n=1 Tax=Actinoplanes sp. NPDC049316 TaxID=3154727 RepID=UPI00342DCB82
MRLGFVALSVSVVSLVTVAAPANASSIYKQCSAGGDELNTTVYYSSNGSYWFVESNSFNLSDNTAQHNNVYMRLRNNGGANTYWAFTSGDDVHGGQSYQYAVNENVPKSGSPYMKTNAIFDQSGSDPNCSTYAYM